MSQKLTIETAYSKYGNPNPGPDEFCAYEHFTHPESSVLAGQRGRRVVDFGTKAQLIAKYPKAEVLSGTTYIDPDFVVPSGSPSDYEEPWDDA